MMEVGLGEMRQLAAYFDVCDPEERDYWRTALVCMTVAASAGSKARIDDFLPSWLVEKNRKRAIRRPAPHTKADPKAIEKKLAAWANAMSRNVKALVKAVQTVSVKTVQTKATRHRGTEAQRHKGTQG